jgi:hypothetical protein
MNFVALLSGANIQQQTLLLYDAQLSWGNLPSRNNPCRQKKTPALSTSQITPE